MEIGYELVGRAQPRLGRPLALVEGRGYAATWLHVRVHREMGEGEER